MNPIMALSMAQELTKSATLPATVRRLLARGAGRALAQGGLVRTVGGGAVGGLLGAIPRGEEGTPEEMSARRRSRIAKGVLLGAAGGYASPLLTSGGRQRAVEGAKRFYSREKHGLLGGAAPASMEHGLSPASLLEHQQAVQQGATSIPGVLKGMVTKPGELIRGGWNQGGTFGKVMTLTSAGMGIKDVMDPEAPGGRAEKAGRMLGETGGYLVGSRLPFMSNMLFSTATGAAGKYLGRAVDKVTGSGQQPLPQAAP